MALKKGPPLLRGRTRCHHPSVHITVFLCETLRVRFILPCVLHASLYLVVRVMIFAGDRNLIGKQRQAKRCEEVWAAMVEVEGRDEKILCLPWRVAPSGRPTVTETLCSRERRPGGAGRGQLTSAGARFSPSSHNLAHSGSGAFFFYNLRQTGTWPEPHLRQARHRPAEGNLPSQLWLRQSLRGLAGGH